MARATVGLFFIYDEGMSTKDRTEEKPRPVPWELRGLPELELFESTSQRNIAIERRRAEFRDSSRWEFQRLLLIMVPGTILADAVANYLNQAIGASRGLKLLLYLVLSTPAMSVAWWLIRRSSAKSLRESLLSLGIPVCRGCGYCLRGLPPDSSRCPECARPLDAETKKLLDK